MEYPSLEKNLKLSPAKVPLPPNTVGSTRENFRTKPTTPKITDDVWVRSGPRYRGSESLPPSQLPSLTFVRCENVRHVITRKRASAGEHFVQHAAKRPDAGPLVE